MKQAAKIGCALVVLYLVCAWCAQAQTCAQQPAISLKNVAEWACKGMDYDAAWDTLTGSGIAPVRPAKIMEMGTKANYGSRKGQVVRVLRIAGFAAGIVGSILANNAQLSDLQLAAIMAGPTVAAEGVQFFAGAPDDFVQTPSDPGFVTIYSGPSNTQIVGSPAPPAPTVTTPVMPAGFRPPSSLELLHRRPPERQMTAYADGMREDGVTAHNTQVLALVAAN